MPTVSPVEITPPVIASPVAVAATVVPFPASIVVATVFVVAVPGLVVALEVAVVMAPLGALILLPAVRMTIAMVVAVAAVYGHHVTPVGMTDVVAIVVDGLTDRRPDDERQGVVFRMRRCG